MAQDARQQAQADPTFATRMDHAREELLQTDTVTGAAEVLFLLIIALLILVIIVIVSLVKGDG